MTSGRKNQWSLTQEAFEELLRRLDADPDAAALKYEQVRARLITLFECQRYQFAEDAADETLNRVARRSCEGVEIENVYAYIHGVARRVLQEARRREQPVPEPVPVQDSAEVEARYACLTECLSKLPDDQRDVILGYYAGDRRSKIDNRVTLADQMGIAMNALRIRTLRIRQKLEACVKHCMNPAKSVK